MRINTFVTALIAALPLAAAAPAGTAAAASLPSRVDGRLFNINGKTQYFAGINAWWMGHMWEANDVDIAMREIAESGLKIVRVWGFGNSNTKDTGATFYQLISRDLPGLKTEINYGYNGIPRFDTVVAAAEKYGVQLVVPFINNWNDLGGINTYCAVFDCDGTTFYTNEGAQAAYENYVTFMVNRYKQSNAIFAWELGNEPRCHGCDTSIIYNWATHISSMIKELDPAHMVALGDEGWLCGDSIEGDTDYPYTCAEGVDFKKNLEIETLDYGTYHLYPDSWFKNGNGTWGSVWIKEHDLLAAAAGKPVVFEEYGINDNHTEVIQEWHRTTLETGTAADQYWQFGSTAPNTALMGDRHTVTYGTEEFDLLFRTHAAAMAAKPVPADE